MIAYNVSVFRLIIINRIIESIKETDAERQKSKVSLWEKNHKDIK